ncbi:hypothetical protein ACOMCU_15920 [Lysinibacillus sp. UGB7]|uniref:hypothetical protein n=1 Tax=Lysinibacillus sp. UGB7 TaxID=3411039 RepID=UPI003B79BBBD
MSSLDTKLKEVKGRRLHRSLRKKFKRRDFEFDWTNFYTAYFDGKTIFVKYDVQKPDKSFSEAEIYLLHLGFAYHEMGHKLYDIVQDFKDWVISNYSANKADWEENNKWPKNIVQTWGNLALDGRLERFLRIDYPFTTDEIDFLNHEWAYPPSPVENRGESKVNDFLEMYGRRCLEMEDLEGWNNEVITLMDQNQFILEEAFIQSTTIECLNKSKEHLIAVWPTLYQWILEENQEPASVSTSPNKDEDLDLSEWANSEDVNTNIQRVMDKLKDVLNGSNVSSKASEESDDKDDKKDEKSGLDEKLNPNEDGIQIISPVKPCLREKPDFKRLISSADKEMENSHIQAEEELKEDEIIDTPITIMCNNTVINDTVTECTYERKNEAAFDEMVASNRKQIIALEKALQIILAPVPETRTHNRKRGRLRPQSIWRAVHCDDDNIRTKTNRGLPTEDASISLMVDISYSTISMCDNNKRVITEMKEALSVVLSAAHKIKLPSKAYAFTSDFDSNTNIYHLKPLEDKLKSQHKGAIGGLSPEMGNRDVIALQYLLNQVQERKESIRLAVMISDGEPNFYENETEETIKEMVKLANKKGIDVFCIFVGNDNRGYECAKRMYGNRVIRSKSGLASNLKRHLIKVLSLRRGL